MTSGEKLFQRRCSECLERDSEGVFWVAPKSGKILYINRTLRKMLGYPAKGKIRLKHTDFESDISIFKDALRDVDGRKPVRYLTEYKCKGGDAIPVMVTIVCSEELGVSYCYVLGMSEQKEAEENLASELARCQLLQADLEKRNEELIHLVSFDFLTGSGSRVSFFREARGALERAKRYGTPLSLLMIDIDLFKRVNDDFGHLRGDDVLVKMTTIIKGSLRAADFMARWGGEEFVIILPQTVKEGAFSLAERLCRRVKAEDFGLDRPLTISIGVAGREETDTIESLIERADHALYEAKGAGRDQASFGPSC